MKILISTVKEVGKDALSETCGIEIKHKNVFEKHCSFKMMLIKLIFKNRFKIVTSYTELAPSWASDFVRVFAFDFCKAFGSVVHHTAFNKLRLYVFLYLYLIDLSPLGLFRANETNNWNKLNKLRIPTDRRQTSWLCTSAAEEVNQGLPRTSPAICQSRTWIWDLQILKPAP